MGKKLTSNFYKQDVLTIAPLLLGKLLIRKVDDQIIKYRITETEAYNGEEDTACHASKGKTPRNAIMYEEGESKTILALEG